MGKKKLTVKTAPGKQREWTNEECVTPTDAGSRIPPATVCPPAPRKRLSPVYFSEDTNRSNNKINGRFREVEIRILFDLPDQNDTSSQVSEIVKMNDNDRNVDKESDSNHN